MHSSGPEEGIQPLRVLFRFRLFSTPYHSSKATMDDTSTTPSRASARSNRWLRPRRCTVDQPDARVLSDRYVVIEDVPFGRRRLLRPVGHEGVGAGQPIELGEPIGRVV
jgi:hypothetical protein